MYSKPPLSTNYELDCECVVVEHRDNQRDVEQALVSFTDRVFIFEKSEVLVMIKVRN